jgi:hypothetical protein
MVILGGVSGCGSNLIRVTAATTYILGRRGRHGFPMNKCNNTDGTWGKLKLDISLDDERKGEVSENDTVYCLRVREATSGIVSGTLALRVTDSQRNEY